MRKKQYDLLPVCLRSEIKAENDPLLIRSAFLEALDARGRTAVVECYPGVNVKDIKRLFEKDDFTLVIDSDDLAVSPEELDCLISDDLTADPVFGFMTRRTLKDFFREDALIAAKNRILGASGRVLVIGVGASLVTRGDFLAIADITRWEIQLRYRKGLSNWHTAQINVSNREKYKRGFFAE